MARRRERIYPRELKDGTTVYDVSLDYHDKETGKRIQRMRTCYTLAEAKTCLADHRSEQARGRSGPPTRVTVAGAFRDWLAERQPHIKPTTYEYYAGCVERHIVPYLGAVELSQVTARRLEQHYSRLHAQGVGPRAVQCVHQRMVQLFNYAHRHRLVGVNEALLATAPAVPKHEMRIWNDSELARFLVAADGSRYGPIWHVAVTTGLRRGELLGLRWCDLDDTHDILHVCQGLTYLRGRLIVQSTKTGRTRKVAVPSSITARLRQHRAQQQVHALASGRPWQQNGLIFTSEIGTPIDPTCLRDDLNRVIEQAGVPRLRIHDLRHTHASWLLRHGRQVREVSERLGHAKTSVTLDVYAHAVPDEHRATADIIERLLMAGA